MTETVTPRSPHEIELELAQIKLEQDDLAHVLADIAAYGFIIDRDDTDATAYRAATKRKSALLDEIARSCFERDLARLGSHRG